MSTADPPMPMPHQVSDPQLIGLTESPVPPGRFVKELSRCPALDGTLDPRVFVGWLQVLISIALWPWLFAIAERLAVAIPYATWIGTDRYDGSLVNGISVIVQGQLMFVALNVLFFFAYLGIPAAAYLLVSGSGRAFRGVLA